MLRVKELASEFSILFNKLLYFFLNSLFDVFSWCHERFSSILSCFIAWLSRWSNTGKDFVPPLFFLITTEQLLVCGELEFFSLALNCHLVELLLPLLLIVSSQKIEQVDTLLLEEFRSAIVIIHLRNALLVHLPNLVYQLLLFGVFDVIIHRWSIVAPLVLVSPLEDGSHGWVLVTWLVFNTESAAIGLRLQ